VYKAAKSSLTYREKNCCRGSLRPRQNNLEDFVHNILISFSLTPVGSKSQPHHLCQRQHIQKSAHETVCSATGCYLYLPKQHFNWQHQIVIRLITNKVGNLSLPLLFELHRRGPAKAKKISLRLTAIIDELQESKLILSEEALSILRAS
jgi:hypothetical protein